MNGLDLKISTKIVEEFKKFPNYNTLLIQVAEHPLSKISSRTLQMIDAKGVIRFDSTHVLLLGKLYELEEITEDVAFNLNLTLDDECLQKYNIAYYVSTKIQLNDECYIFANLANIKYEICKPSTYISSWN